MTLNLVITHTTTSLVSSCSLVSSYRQHVVHSIQVVPSALLTHMSAHANVHMSWPKLLTTFSVSCLSSFILQPSVCSSLSHRPTTCPPCDCAASCNPSKRRFVVAAQCSVSDSSGWCMCEKHACLTCEGQKKKPSTVRYPSLSLCVCPHCRHSCRIFQAPPASAVTARCITHTPEQATGKRGETDASCS